MFLNGFVWFSGGGCSAHSLISVFDQDTVQGRAHRGNGSSVYTEGFRGFRQNETRRKMGFCYFSYDGFFMDL